MNQLALQHVLKSKQTAGLKSAKSITTHSQTIGSYQQSLGQYIHFVSAVDKLSEAFELIKILRQHQHSNRWTLLIAPQNIPDKALLDCCSVDMNHVLVVHEKQITSIMATIENALLGSTCSAIVAWGNQWSINSGQLEHINQLAKKSHCLFYAFDIRKETVNLLSKTH